jgi:2'-hydroxyisoflavone reductase
MSAGTAPSLITGSRPPIRTARSLTEFAIASKPPHHEPTKRRRAFRGLLKNLRHAPGRELSASVDPSGYTPEHVRTAAETLGKTIEHYTFISSISVYQHFPPGRSFDEDAPVAEGSDGYGALKARAEEELEAVLPGRVARVRPGLIVGPHDPTDRFTYWPRRVARGGCVLAPGRPERPIQFVDVRDLAAWCVRLSEVHHVGVFNAVGPATRLTMGQLLDECRTVAKSDAHFTWVPDQQLAAAGVNAWTEVPLWIPEDDQCFGGMLLADNRRAVAAGLTSRPIAETIQATLEWDRQEGASPGKSSIRVTLITREREAELLAGRV